MLLLIISFLVIAVYTAAVCIKAKGVPYSISATYYTLDHKLIFGASMALTAMFLFPVIWEMSTTFTMRLLAIAACIGLIGVGLAPDFKDTWINRIHCGKRLSGNIWQDFVSTKPMFWCEIAALSTTFGACGLAL